MYSKIFLQLISLSKVKRFLPIGSLGVVHKFTSTITSVIEISFINSITLRLNLRKTGLWTYPDGHSLQRKHIQIRNVFYLYWKQIILCIEWEMQPSGFTFDLFWTVPKIPLLHELVVDVYWNHCKVQYRAISDSDYSRVPINDSEQLHGRRQQVE